MTLIPTSTELSNAAFWLVLLAGITVVLIGVVIVMDFGLDWIRARFAKPPSKIVNLEERRRHLNAVVIAGRRRPS